MKRRYFSPVPLAEGQSVALEGPEAHHLMHVLRARADDDVILFDGQGAEFLARVVQIARSTITLSVGERIEICRELKHPLYLGVPAPKTDRQKQLIEKAVELGVAAITPLVTAHSEQASPQCVAKWSRYVIEASKQCGRNRLMDVTPQMPWKRWLTTSPIGVDPICAPIAQRYVAHPGGIAPSSLALRTPAPAMLAVGPEAGFTESEIDLAIAEGWQIIDLGSRIVRMETAVAVMATLAGLQG